ncbi:MAG: ERCC4 domain-containing protein [Nanoarchaeota archaeon]|nr:ERCC4 domain-containing protein [Nanoarchaeota archaeon]
MFHNIFSRKSNKELKEKIKPKIIADIHEKDSLILAELAEKEKNKEIELIIQPLKIGDYLIGNTVIERKTISDFISSMISRRIIEQLRQMKQYKSQLLILEGNLNDSEFNQNALRGFILSIIANYQIPIIMAQDYKDTSQFLTILAKQQLKPKTEISLHSRIPKTLKEQKQYVLESFPNIGPKTAKKLLKEFKTLNNTINASEEGLNKILKKKTAEFKKILNS